MKQHNSLSRLICTKIIIFSTIKQKNNQITKLLSTVPFVSKETLWKNKIRGKLSFLIHFPLKTTIELN